MRLSGLGKRTLAEFIRRHGNGRGKKLFYQRVESGQLKSMVISEPVQEVKVEEVVEQPKPKKRKKSLLSKEEE